MTAAAALKRARLWTAWKTRARQSCGRAKSGLFFVRLARRGGGL